VVGSVRVSGAFGSSAAVVNGLYQSAGTTYNGRLLFRKTTDPDKWLRFGPSRVWIVSDTRAKEENNTLGWATSTEANLDTPLDAKAWNIFTDGKWVQQRAATAVKISGITGSSAEIVNGIYDVTNTQLNDHFLFQKQGDPDKFLRYAANGAWMVGDTKNKDENNNLGWAFSSNGQRYLPEDTGSWTVFSNGKWVDQYVGTVQVQKNPVIPSHCSPSSCS
jgi:hypothetical protein